MEKTPITKQAVVKRRHVLPHWQHGGSTYFVTFRSNIGELDEPSRRLVLETLKKGNLVKFQLNLAVVMPDHVHLILRPLRKERDEYWDLSSIMQGIKGASSRAINQRLGRTGRVWQRESFDRMIRDEKEYGEIEDYVLRNPITAGLSSQIGEYGFMLDLRGDDWFRDDLKFGG